LEVRKKNGCWGSAILSKFEIIKHAIFLIWPEERVMLSVDLALPTQDIPFTIFNLHLDNSSEHFRLLQLKNAFSDFSVQKNPHMIVGDFNSVHVDDYPPEIWEKIKEKRKKKRLGRTSINSHPTNEKLGLH